MSCHKCRKTKCGCGDKPLSMPANFSNDPTVCPPDAEPCTEVFLAGCVCWPGPDICELDIKEGDRMDEVLRKLILTITQISCNVAGEPGEDGQDGQNGINGTNGLNGADGQSIDHSSFTSSTGGGGPGIEGETDTYTVWGDALQTINLGSFLVYNGADGAQGIQGIQGLQGIQGDQGNQGDPGIQGPQGNPGTLANAEMIAVQGTVAEFDDYVFDSVPAGSESITLNPTSIQDSSNGVWSLVLYNTFPGPSPWDPVTGIFTCPATGIYDFSFVFSMKEDLNIDPVVPGSLERGFYAGEMQAGIFVKGPGAAGGPYLPVCMDSYDILTRRVQVTMNSARIGYSCVAGQEYVLRAQQMTGTNWTKSGQTERRMEIRRIT